MVRNIWAVGRNYSAHAKELGNAVQTSDADPMIFLKAGSSMVENGASFALPSFSNEINFEAEIAFRFGKGGQFSGLTIALDLTARDWQTKLKNQGHPWTLAKSFSNSCPLGPMVDLPKGLNLDDLRFTLTVNGELRQKGHSRDMVHSPEKLRAYVASRFPVCEGDLLLTGTPEGVGVLAPGDVLRAEITGLVNAAWTVAGKAL
jgi:2-keto-4-pentenoate hydratase/2-oxohepta-3-ene-1,7-dioic acid hydratase in catechol pathway